MSKRIGRPPGSGIYRIPGYEWNYGIVNTLREARIEKKVTQKEVARSLEVHINSVALWETKKNEPTISNLIGWANALGYDLKVEKKELP